METRAVTSTTSTQKAAAQRTEDLVPLRPLSVDIRPPQRKFSPQRKRIMIVDPPFKRLYHNNASLVKFPLALGYLSGAVLKWTDWEVQAYNADFNPAKKAIAIGNVTRIKEGMAHYLRTLDDPTAPIWAEIRSAITEFDPGVVGISSKTQNFPSAMEVARIAKEHNPDTLVVLGGPHATLSTTAALDCPHIDMAVLGEGEMTLVELLKAWESGAPLNEVAGLAYREDDHKVLFTPSRTNMHNLDQLPFPAQAAPQVLRDYESYPPEAFGYVFSARGCPYSCTFCESKAIWTQKTRWRSPQNVVQELKLLTQRGVRYVYFDDDTFGIHPRYIEELCSLIETECPGLKWGCEITVGVVKERSIEWMRRSGCVRVNIGIESGNNRILRGIKKGHTIEKAYPAVNLCQRKDIEVGAFFMVGFPEETEETLRDTLTAIKRINADNIMLSIFTPYPGSELFQVCKELGVVDDDFDITIYNHQSPENCFTAFIPRERFKELVQEATAIVGRKNSRGRWRRVARMLRQRDFHRTQQMAREFLFTRAAWCASRIVRWSRSETAA